MVNNSIHNQNSFNPTENSTKLQEISHAWNILYQVVWTYKESESSKLVEIVNVTVNFNLYFIYFPLDKKLEFHIKWRLKLKIQNED